MLQMRSSDIRISGNMRLLGEWMFGHESQCSDVGELRLN